MSGLTEEQIGQIVDAYRLQMARYEAVAKLVEQRLRRELRAAALPVLLSSRAKHSEDLREKLAETLRFVIERILERPVTGEIEKLFRLLRSLAGRLTVREIEKLDLRRAASRGAVERAARGYPPDDVIELALGLLDTFPEEFRMIASSWRGPSTPLKRAILE